jgi:hypothetical protein
VALGGTAPLRRELARSLPDRPFSLRLWDGSELPAAVDGGGPTFTLRSPRALGHVLRAPGQLGLGRAYVSGLLEIDDLDAALRTLGLAGMVLSGGSGRRLMGEVPGGAFASRIRAALDPPSRFLEI